MSAPSSQRYAEALRAHLASPSEESRVAAYSLGRELLAGGSGVLSIVQAHHDALHEALAAGAASGSLLFDACDFLEQCLSSFEMAQRGYVDVIHELQRRNTVVEEATRLKSVFLANMSHELRTPLSSILGFSELLEDALARSAEPRLLGFVADISSAGHHLLGLINDILDLSRIEAGRLELTLAAVPVGEVVGEALGLVRGVAARKAVRLESQVEDLPPLKADRTRLRQVLVNLLSNAVKFSPSGAVVTLTGARAGASVELSVRDEGAGIPAELLPRLFEPFVQGGNAQSQRQVGTGLGLAISRQLALRHGGSVSASSPPGQGAVFTLCWPIASSGLPPPSAAETTPPAESVEARPSGPAVVLVVDDDALSRKLTRAVLQPRGYTVVDAATASQAVMVASSAAPALVLLDIELPDHDGFWVRDRLVEDARTAAIPVLAFTAHAMQGDRERILARGFDGYLARPADAEQMVAEVSRVLATSRRRRSG